MGAVVKSKSNGYLILDPLLEREVTRTGWGLRILKPLKVLSLNTGEETLDTQLKAGQKVILDFGTIAKNKFQCFLKVNPDLERKAIVSFPTFFEPDQDETPLEVIVRVEKQLELEDLTWFLEICQVD